MNKNDFSSIIQNFSKVETIPISIDNYNRMDKLCLQFTVFFKNCHRIFDTPFIKMWGLSSFPLNPGRHVSISTHRAQWKWCCVSSVDDHSQQASSGNPVHMPEEPRPRGEPAARAQPPLEQPLSCDQLSVSKEISASGYRRWLPSG